MNNEIQISSVMLCFNRLELSKKCLASYLNTISVPYELIIVDNASTDGTREWLEGVGKDPRIKEVIHMQENDPAAALNQGLATCTGRYLHVMENDYIYLGGWDKYMLDRFQEIADLGQLCICTGSSRMKGAHHRNLVYLSTGNVVSSSLFRRAIFFDHDIRWRNMYKGLLPDDGNFSSAVNAAGYLVAWPDKPISEAVGFSSEEFRKEPDYYIENYKQKLRASMRGWYPSQSVREAMGRLVLLYWAKFTKPYRQ